MVVMVAIVAAMEARAMVETTVEARRAAMEATVEATMSGGDACDGAARDRDHEHFRHFIHCFLAFCFRVEARPSAPT